MQASITWEQCADLPTKLSHGKTVVINGKVYCGGETITAAGDYTIYCYDPSQDNWTTLPPLPVRYFGLGEVSGKLVAVGGMKSNDSVTNVVYTYDERARRWKRTVPPMPTARYGAGVLSLKSALFLVGGVNSDDDCTDAVELFKPDTSQWYTTDPLPTGRQSISLTVIGNTCYALGGYHYFGLNQALFASVDDLLRNAKPADQTTVNGSSDTQSAWMLLVNTPTYQPAAAVLAGNLLAIGGKETSRGRADMKEVYMFSPSSQSWIYISDLPAPRSTTTTAFLSSTEILVIGGWCDNEIMNSVYKGTLYLKL